MTTPTTLAPIATLEKTTKGVNMNISLSSITLTGRLVIEHEGETHTLDLAKLPSKVAAHLFAYGLGRHAPDSLSTSDKARFNDISLYMDTYVEGYNTPKEKEKALKVTTTTASKKGKSKAVGIAPFLSFVESLALSATKAEAKKLYLVIDALEPSKASLTIEQVKASLPDLVASYESDLLAKAKEAQAAAEAKANESLDALKGIFK